MALARTPFIFCLLFGVLCMTSLSQDMYCGDKNCYDILGLQESATVSEIKKSYRRQALKWHPDKNNNNNNPDALEMFRDIATAYEVLSSVGRRYAYDYYLAHPEEQLRNQYNYYRHSYAPDVRLASFPNCHFSPSLGGSSNCLHSHFFDFICNSISSAKNTLRPSCQVLEVANEGS